MGHAAPSLPGGVFYSAKIWRGNCPPPPAIDAPEFYISDDYEPALSSFPQAYCVTFISHDLLVEVEGAILNEAY